MKIITIFLLFTNGILISTIGFCREETKIAVLYPDVSKPYSIVFDQIISGIKEHKGISLRQYGVTENNDSDDFNRWLQDQKPEAIIALGRRSTELVQQLQPNIPIIVGGILNSSDPYIDKLPGISLTPDPNLLFVRLKSFSPDIKRVYVVFNPDNYSWLMNIAQIAAEKHGLILVAKPANSLRESALIHKEILENSNKTEDSVWLLQDPTTVGSESILPYILKEAWEKKLLIFSSSPEHVARGVLFSLYADNVKHGNNLANLAITILKNNSNEIHGLTPLKSVRIAVNTRTAGHIGLRIPFEVQREFDLVFPRR